MLHALLLIARAITTSTKRGSRHGGTCCPTPRRASLIASLQCARHIQRADIVALQELLLQFLSVGQRSFQCLGIRQHDSREIWFDWLFLLGRRNECGPKPTATGRNKRWSVSGQTRVRHIDRVALRIVTRVASTRTTRNQDAVTTIGATIDQQSHWTFSQRRIQ